MTYGWAILIIVIVAVILYSMGIFNPSSSVTFTSSGFSPFTISSVICSQDGLSFSILAGPVPNGAYSMSINSFYIISSTGTNTSRISYALKNPITLKSGQTGVIAIPNVICPSSGAKVSISGNVQYSYSTLAGKVVTNATGTLAGTATHGPTLPAGIQYYSQITISNSQSSATPSPFQQMINFTSSDPGFSLIATGNFGQNVEFFYSNGTVIPSWLENYTSNHALWWLKIAAISGGSSETVYVGFAPISISLFNTVNDGEANSATDDLSDVFPSSLKNFHYTGGTIFSNNYFGLGFVIESIGSMPFNNAPYFQMQNQNNNWNPWWEFYSPNNLPTSNISTLLGNTPIPIEGLKYGFEYVYNINSSTQATVEVTNGYTQFSSFNPQYSTSFIVDGDRGINITFADIFQFSVPIYGMPSVSFGSVA